MKLLRFFKFFALAIISIALFWFLACLALYRIPEGVNPMQFEGNVHYKFLELGLENRSFFEGLLGNGPARLIGAPELFVSESDRKLLWSESPWEMREKHYTFRARLAAKPLMFGGYGLAQVMSIKRVNEEPSISK
jgi:hypothetical protein